MFDHWLGKFTIHAIPYDNPIIMSAAAFMALVTLLVLGTLTFYGKWTWLWKGWLTSLDHKKIGSMYVILAMVMLLRGFEDAAMMRAQQAMAAGAEPGYLPPHHFDQIFSAHGTIMIVFMAMPFLTGLINVEVLAEPPADFMMHNSEFLVAHFHNMLIPGALFGYLAGYMYWFPKAFGFRLNDRWEKIAFWNWLIGFLLAFMPLYMLGFMGMPRRMEHYGNPAWQPYLIVAAVGAVFIGFGILSLIVQLVVSVQGRQENRDLSGDPWNGRHRPGHSGRCHHSHLAG
ncbi:MAG: cbb3-type cytochrome c oxidase subunit I [Thiogranum sp.]|nr:cbb3-type cytochrome c oxidase subunit I [Thiogranum sp.]